MKQATIANLAQAGLPHRYWHMAMKHAQTGLNIAKPGWGCSSAWEARHGAPFDELHVPFGALVKFIPNKTSNMWDDRRPFDPKPVLGVFLGYRLNHGHTWSKQYEIAPYVSFDAASSFTGRAKTAG